MRRKNDEKRIKVFVAMSGGVDSSVAALLLKKEDYDLVGCYIKGWYPSGIVCSWKEDRRDAMRICAKLGIPFITIDAEKEYKKEVVDYMISEYKEGRTPNPDIMCNKHVKFGVFLKKALAMGADYIATGHYVRLAQLYPRIFSLCQARDPNKDQSYFLWTLTQEQLKYCLFPLGDLTKAEVRKLAAKNGLVTAEKEESQGVCFIGEFNMEDFLKRYIKSKEGKVMTTDGKTIGYHDGLAFYTVGQRHGFGFGGGAGGPYYVVDKDFKKNILVVAEKGEEGDYGKTEIKIRDSNWISGQPERGKKYRARIRYRQPLESCEIKFSGSKLQVVFDKTQRAATSGQSLVIYDGDEMKGGGTID